MRSPRQSSRRRRSRSGFSCFQSSKARVTPREPLARRAFVHIPQHLQVDFLGRGNHVLRIGTDMGGSHCAVDGACGVLGDIEAKPRGCRIGQQCEDIGMEGDLMHVGEDDARLQRWRFPLAVI
ncbi:hypothetical protein A4U53_011680 [Rhizobium ruizarguesonis]|uniref:Uncharacterized protein n=1 Tax=Rhizobium ruizarguesonis TaxID=2081791 RepID=A0ACD5EQI6_9HYPH